MRRQFTVTVGSRLFRGLFAALLVFFALAYASPAFAGCTPPETTITAGPSGYVASASASFSFTSDCIFATFQCSLDGSTFATCTSPASYTVANGSHTFRVRAIYGKHVDGSPASRTWTADTIVPNTTITAAPSSPTANATLTFSFTATETVSRFDCSLDAASWFTCSSPQSVGPVSDGVHEFRVRAVDLAGNTDASPAFSDVLVDAESCQ